MVKLITLLTSLVLFSCSHTALSNDQLVNDLTAKDLKLETLVDLETEVIWGFTFNSENEILFTTRDGLIYALDLSNKKAKVIYRPEVEVLGQGGLLDIEKFEINGKSWIYTTFSKKVKTQNGSVVTTALARFDYKEGNVENYNTIFVANVKSDTGRHFGSRLAYDGKYIFMTVGERGERKFSQDLRLHNGKILRLLPNGEAAPDNPFAEKGGLKEIYSYGHRNPQGIAYEKGSGRLFSCEFGPRGGDELNLVEAGKNYGWPVITYGKEYFGPSIGPTHKEGMEQPLAYWVPSISPSGMMVYSGEVFPEWKGNVFLANLSGEHIRRVSLDKKTLKVTGQQRLLADLEERIRAIKEGPKGNIFFSTDTGKIVKLSPKK